MSAIPAMIAQMSILARTINVDGILATEGGLSVKKPGGGGTLLKAPRIIESRFTLTSWPRGVSLQQGIECGSKKELSAQYGMYLAPSENSARDGYDFVMTKITFVNSVAITTRGRGGVDVRVLDNMTAIDKVIGRNKMRSGFLSFLGIRKPKDTNFKFSDALFGGIAKARALDAADASGIEKAVGEAAYMVLGVFGNR
jgi:hypothetical protein